MGSLRFWNTIFPPRNIPTGVKDLFYKFYGYEDSDVIACILFSVTGKHTSFKVEITTVGESPMEDRIQRHQTAEETQIK